MTHTNNSAATDINMTHEYRINDPSLARPLQQTIFALQKLADSGTIEASTRELVKIRASQINGCAYCLAMHWRDAIKAGERIDRLSTLVAWREADWFTPRERAAMVWTEALTDLPDQQVHEELFAACREVFSEQEMIDLTTNILAINNWNRVAIGFSARPQAFEPEVK